MKKVLFMILALSSVTFAGVTTTHGNNINPSATETSASASINVNVSAIVSGANPSLVITDTNGKEISGVEFTHYLKISNNEKANLIKNIDIQARSEYFQGITSGSHTVSFDNTTANLTGTNSSNKISSELSVTQNTIDFIHGILPIKLTNSFTEEASTPFIADTYTSPTNKLTVSFTKTLRGQF